MTISPTSRATAGRATAFAGIGLMLAGVLLFSINDAVGKWLLATYSVGQLLLLRSAATLLLLSPLIWRAGKAAFTSAPRPGLQLLRIVLSTLEVAMFFWAVSYMPLADAITFYLAGPIYVTALSVLILRERVGWRRWTAVLVGFAGVVIALRPSAATLTLPALIALGGSVFYALLMVITFIFGALAAPLGWVTPSAYDMIFLSGFGAISIMALFCINRSLKLAPASVVVPFQYTLILWGVLLGWRFFGEVPDVFTLVGAAIIVAAGLYIFWREQAAARETSFTPPP